MPRAFLLGIALLSCTERATSPDLNPRRPGAARPDESATRPSIVISQIYGGGGNSGATFKNDFIELFNPGSDAVSSPVGACSTLLPTGTLGRSRLSRVRIPAGRLLPRSRVAGSGRHDGASHARRDRHDRDGGDGR